LSYTIIVGCADVRKRVKLALSDALRTSAHPTVGAIF